MYPLGMRTMVLGQLWMGLRGIPPGGLSSLGSPLREDGPYGELWEQVLGPLVACPGRNPGMKKGVSKCYLLFWD